MNNQMNSKRESFKQYMKATAKKKFAVISIDSREKVADVENNFGLIKDLIKRNSSLVEIIDAAGM